MRFMLVSVGIKSEPYEGYRMSRSRKQVEADPLAKRKDIHLSSCSELPLHTSRANVHIVLGMLP
jgi:hypothetical protein